EFTPFSRPSVSTRVGRCAHRRFHDGGRLYGWGPSRSDRLWHVRCSQTERRPIVSQPFERGAPSSRPAPSLRAIAERARAPAPDPASRPTPPPPQPRACAADAAVRDAAVPAAAALPTADRTSFARSDPPPTAARAAVRRSAWTGPLAGLAIAL